MVRGRYYAIVRWHTYDKRYKTLEMKIDKERDVPESDLKK